MSDSKQASFLTQFKWRDILAAFISKRILVIGDVMLDEYIWGNVSRISPEAPVPVVEVQNKTRNPGGAANVAMNLTAFGALPILAGVIGGDNAGAFLKESLLKQKLIGEDSLIVSRDRPTTVKLRIMAHNQQLLRIDVEIRSSITGSEEDMLLSWGEKHLITADALVLSDYGKGVLTPRVCQGLIQMANQRHLPVIVDPKGTDYTKYFGATLVTPNLNEAMHHGGVNYGMHKNLEEAVQSLFSLLDKTYILVTQGAEGMTLFRKGHSPLRVLAHAQNVFDVTGAGDTVVATLVLALAAGAYVEDAVKLANLGAGIVVGKLGTATVTRAELEEVLATMKDPL